MYMILFRLSYVLYADHRPMHATVAVLPPSSFLRPPVPRLRLECCGFICGICDLSRHPALTAAFSGLLNSLLSHATLTAAFTATVVLRLLRLGLSRPCRSLCRILDSCGKRGPALSRGPRAMRGAGAGSPRTSYFCRSASARRSQRSPAHASGRDRGHPAD